MKLHELSPGVGEKTKSFRRGRGIGSGNGKTAGRGHKGQKSRSGYSRRRGFEGGQMRLALRMPKRGFNNIFAAPYTAVNLYQLERFEDGDVVGVKELIENGIIKKCEGRLKILGVGELTKKVTVKANAFSASAKEKIEAAGGKAEVV